MTHAETMNMLTMMANVRIDKEKAEAEARHLLELQAITKYTVEWVENTLLPLMRENAEKGYFHYWMKFAKMDSDGNVCQMEAEKIVYANGKQSYKIWGDGIKLNFDLIVTMLTASGYDISVTNNWYKSYGYGDICGKEICIGWDKRG